MKRNLLFITLIFALFLTACGSDSAATSSARNPSGRRKVAAWASGESTGAGGMRSAGTLSAWTSPALSPFWANASDAANGMHTSMR